MPRLLPRLLDALTASRKHRNPAFSFEQTPTRRPRVRSRYHPLPPPTKTSFHAHGRERSVVLESPIEAFKPPRRHKRQPPWPRLARNQIQRRKALGDELDPPRLMAEQERQWWSSPYLRMLSSPLREDKISGRIMPSDFLIRIGALRLPSPRASTKVEHILVPDGLLHPRFARSRTGLGAHVLCRRDGLPRLNERSALHRIIPHLRPHPHLAAQISNALRLRVLHELEVLTTDLAYHPVGAHDAPLLRRLTRREFAAFRAGEPLPDLGAVAVLVVPPVNRDPVSKTRPERPSPMDPRPLVPEPEQPPAKRPHKALSALHEIASVNAPASQGPEAEGSWFKGFSPPHAAQVPLYNGAVLFPHRGQRAALHTALCALLKPDRKALWRRNEPTPGETKPHPVGMDRASHAFLLRSDADTVRRADSVPLAIALWRLRMWEGDAWETGAHVSQWDVTI